MTEAETEATTADIRANNYLFRATGSVITFDGYLKIYPSDTKDTRLPPLSEKENLDLIKLHLDQHFTEPPPHYTEAA